MSIISQNKQAEGRDVIEIQPIETERYNMTEDDVLSMLYGAGDFDNASLLVENSQKGED